MRRLDRAFNGMAALGFLLSALAFATADGDALVALFALAVSIWAWLYGRANRPAVARWLVTSLLGGALLVVLLSVTRGGEPLVSRLSQFLVLIGAIKLFDRRSPRDEGQLLALCVFTGIGAVLTSNSLPVGLLVIVAASVLLRAAMLLHLRAGRHAVERAHEAVTAERAPIWRVVAPAHAPPDSPGAQQQAMRSLRRVALACFMLIMALSVAAFVFTPRGLLRANVFGRFGMVGSSVGFNDRISLGVAGPRPGSGKPVLDVRIMNEQGQSVADSTRALYLRGSILNDYDPRTRSWRRIVGRSRQDSSPLRAGQAYSVGDLQGSRAPLRRLEVSFRAERATSGYLFTTWRPISIEINQPSRIEAIDQSRVLQLRNPGPVSRYTVLTRPDDLARNGGAMPRLIDPDEPAADSTAYLEGVPSRFFGDEGRSFADPRGDPPNYNVYPAYAPWLGFSEGPIRELAETILTNEGIPVSPLERSPNDNRRAAEAIERHLSRTCAYTLDAPPVPPGQDPIEYFLFEQREGHCEYFASAQTALCRAIGIDARLVTGYLVTEPSPIGDLFVVRESDAHAWTEAQLGPGLWVTFDPSPERVRSQVDLANSGWLARLREWYDAIDFAWADAIVGFDETTQADLLGGEAVSGSRLASAAERFFRRFASSRHEADRDGRGVWTTWMMFGAIGLVGAAGGVFVLIRRRLVRRRAGRGPGVDLGPHAETYLRALRLLATAGVAKPPSLPPLLHVDDVEQRQPALAEPFRTIVEAYYTARFAGAPDPAMDHEALLALERMRSVAAPGPR